MKGFVRRGKSPDRNVSRAFVSTLVTLFLVSWVFFFVEPASALYVGEDIGCAGYNTHPTGINDLDQVAGYRYWYDINLTASYSDAIVYDPGTGTWIELPDFGAGHGIAQDISEDGDVVGHCRGVGGETKGAYWPTGYDSVVVLEHLYSSSFSSFALGMNDVHEAVGQSRSATTTTAVLWQLDPNATAITPLDLGAVEGADMTRAVDINNNHEVVGIFYLDFNTSTPHYQAFYCAGYGNPLQTLLPLSEGWEGPHSVAASISDSGMIVGMSADLAGAQHAVAWLPPYDTAPVDLGAIVGIPSSAQDVSTNEMITGVGPGGAFVLDYMSGLCEYLAPPSGIVGSCIGYAINDRGHVAGMGTIENEDWHAILWTPDSPPVAAFTAVVSGLDVTVDASASYDAEGEITGYSWDFGDGTYGAEVIMTHTYATAGPYTITLSVNDSVGQYDSVSLVISTLEEPEIEAAELLTLIEECTSFDEGVEDVLTAKVTHALDLIESRKSHGASSILLAFDNLVSNYVLVGKIADEYEAWDLIAQANFVISLLTENHMIAGVPLYTWYHGCGPAAAGMLVGYWDSMGFGDLVKGLQGNELYQSPEVNAMMASQGHIDDYVYPLDGWIDGAWVDIQADNSTPGCVAHPDDCVADFMHTSRSADGLVYGQSYADMVDDALVGYTDWASGGRYVGTASIFHQGSMSWEDLQVQVDAAHPMAFVVDWDGDGESDHLVTVVGYCEIGKAQLYAFYSTWDNNVWWALYDIMQEGNFYGVFAAVTYGVSIA